MDIEELIKQKEEFEQPQFHSEMRHKLPLPEEGGRAIIEKFFRAV